MTESKIAYRHPVYAKNISLRDSEDMSRTPKIFFFKSKKNLAGNPVYILPGGKYKSYPLKAPIKGIIKRAPMTAFCRDFAELL